MKRKMLLLLFVALIGNGASAVELDEVASPDQIYQELVERYGWVENKANMLATSVRIPPVYIVVDKSDQMLHLWVNDNYEASWDVSTGKGTRVCPPNRGCYNAVTPNGIFRPFRMHARYKSKLWDARMDYAVFFNGGIALHATEYERGLGRPGSGGCVRQSYRDAEYIFRLIKRYGMRNTLIKVRN